MMEKKITGRIQNVSALPKKRLRIRPPNEDRAIVVRVFARGSYSRKEAEMVKREIATALNNIGAYEVTTIGDFAGNGVSPDPERLAILARIASRGVRVRVVVGRD